MPVFKKLLTAAVVTAAFASAGVLVSSDVSAKPKQVTTMKLPAGATVQRLSSTQFRVRGGLGVGGTYSCSCSSTGSCSTVQTEGTLECGKSGDSCKGTCSMSTTTSGGGKIMMKRN
jgi:hypothetical protein